MFCYQRNHNQQVQVIANEQQLMDILRDPEVKKQVAAAREAKAMGNDESYSVMKRGLPLLIFSASSFDQTKKKKKDGSEGPLGYWRVQKASHLNGLAVLDIDHIPEPRQLAIQLTEKFAKNFEDSCEKWKIFMMYVTPSAEGLKIVFAADPSEGNIADNQVKFSAYLGIDNDISIKDSSRGQFAVHYDDVVFLTPAIVDYYDEEFEKKYGEMYRNGQSAPIKTKGDKRYESQKNSSNAGNSASSDSATGNHDSNNMDSNSSELVTQKTGEAVAGDENAHEGIDDLKFGDVPVRDLAVRYADKYGSPIKGDRHRSLIKVAGHLRYLVDNKPSFLKMALREIPWVREWEAQEHNASEIDDIADDVCTYKMWRELPKAIQSIVQSGSNYQYQSGNRVEGSSSERAFRSDSTAIQDRLLALLEDDPIYSVCTSLMPDANKVAGVFAAGGMFATLATRVHYLHYDGQQHRMNPQVFIIGKPASGKSMADWLDQCIMAVLRASDEPGRKAEADYKKEQKKRRTSNKAAKGERQLEEPEVCIRYIPSRTSNAVFYKRQMNAKELVDGEVMPLHLYTFDSELDSSVAAQSGGSWIGKHDLELKAFHNEFSGVDYANSDSVNEVIQVFWNQIVTGTDVSLSKKINMRNVNDGLCSRIAICRIESDDFAMIDKGDYEAKVKASEELKKWGERFDSLKGEVIVPKLVEHCYKLCEKAAMAAKLDDDHVIDYFRKRAVFYAEWFTIVRVLARAILSHEKDEKVNIMKPQIKKSDLDFAEFIFDTIIYYQDIFFGRMLEDVWHNASNSFIVRKQSRTTRNQTLFESLPESFDAQQVMDLFSLNRSAVAMQCNRWQKLGWIQKTGIGVWKKIS